MSVQYKIITNCEPNLNQMLTMLHHVASFQFKVDKQESYWLLDCELGRFVLKFENSDWYADVYHMNLKAEQVLTLSIEVNLKDALMDVINACFHNSQEDLVMCYDEQPYFQRHENQVMMAPSWPKRWGESCTFPFEIHKIDVNTYSV